MVRDWKSKQAIVVSLVCSVNSAPKQHLNLLSLKYTEQLGLYKMASFSKLGENWRKKKQGNNSCM